MNDPTPNVGEIVTYTLTLTNNGPDTATNVRTADRLPAGLSFVSATPSQGTYDPASGTWVVGTVTTSSPQTLMIRARVVSPTPQANIGTITHSDQFEPSPSDNTDGVALLPQQADLALAKSVNDTIPHVGDTIAYTVTLTNNGPDSATNVQVTDPLPAGVSFVSAMPSQGTYDPSTGLWSVGTVHLDFPETLVILARVDSPGSQINTAAITHSDQFDPSPANNAQSVVVFAMPIAPPTVTSLLRFGFHDQPTEFVLTFSSALDPTRAQDTQNYTLTPIGPSGHLGRRIRIAAAVYNPLANTVTLHPANRLYLYGRYKLVVNGMPPAGLAGPSGILLDGLGNGIPGSDYVKNFGPWILAGPYRRISSPTNHEIRHVTSAHTHSSTTPQESSHQAAAERRAERPSLLRRNADLAGCLRLRWMQSSELWILASEVAVAICRASLFGCVIYQVDGSQPTASAAIGFDEFQKAEIEDLIRSLGGLADDDRLPREVGPHLLRLDELPLEGSVGRGHRRGRHRAGADDRRPRQKPEEEAGRCRRARRNRPRPRLSIP